MASFAQATCRTVQLHCQPRMLLFSLHPDKNWRSTICFFVKGLSCRRVFERPRRFGVGDSLRTRSWRRNGSGISAPPPNWRGGCRWSRWRDALQRSSQRGNASSTRGPAARKAPGKDLANTPSRHPKERRRRATHPPISAKEKVFAPAGMAPRSAQPSGRRYCRSSTSTRTSTGCFYRRA